MAAVRAFHKLHEIHQSKVKMVISGCGELENEIKEFISSNKLTDSVVWMNDFKDWYDLRNLYKNADVLLTIGVYNTWSLTVIEAMASGMPVIASHTTEAASAQVIHDYNGFLVQHGDIEATVEAMNNYVEKPNLLELHSERCRSIARSSSCDVVAKRLHKLITTN
jgi:glycosyltransferase involved in cell wall biosynthesis